MNSALNKNIPCRTIKEKKDYHKKYIADNRETLSKREKKWRDENKEKTIEYHKKYRITEKHCQKERKHGERKIKKKDDCITKNTK